MGLDTFGDVTVGADGSPVSQAQVIRDIVDEGRLAEEVGVDFFGVGEHHRADFAVSSPEVVLSVIAGHTRKIKLGSAVTVLSSDDPVRVYQRFATLHAASNGRAEVILGRGAFTESFPLFGYDLTQYSALFEEKLDLLLRIVAGRSVTWEGKFRPTLTNQPVYPPIEGGGLKIWVAVGSTPESVVRAANHRLPMIIGIIGGPPERFKPFVEMYRYAFQRFGTQVEAIGVQSPGHIADTDTEACEQYWEAYQPLRDRLGAERGWQPITRSKFDVEVTRGSLYVGSPETVARKIAATVKELGISRFELKYSTGTLSHGRLLRSIELYGRRVIPLVRDML